MDKSIVEIYGNKVRTRVCGLCWQGDSLLMVNHRGLHDHDFWSPPGGGIVFGQSAESNLVREFKEETGLDIRVERFQFACEFVHPPLHAIELFFLVGVVGGELELGRDPEMPEKEQIIKDVRFLSCNEIESMPESQRHGVFRLAKNREKILNLQGYLII